jgi:hypothetical protein
MVDIDAGSRYRWQVHIPVLVTLLTLIPMADIDVWVYIYSDGRHRWLFMYSGSGYRWLRYMWPGIIPCYLLRDLEVEMYGDVMSVLYACDVWLWLCCWLCLLSFFIQYGNVFIKPSVLHCGVVYLLNLCWLTLVSFCHFDLRGSISGEQTFRYMMMMQFDWLDFWGPE